MQVDDYRLMQIERIAECSPSKGSILQYFRPSAIKTFALSIFEWPLKTSFTVYSCACMHKENDLKMSLFGLDSKNENTSISQICSKYHSLTEVGRVN